MKIGLKVILKQHTVFDYEEVQEKGRTVTKKVVTKKAFEVPVLAIITGFAKKSVGIHHHAYGNSHDGDQDPAYLEITSTYDVVLVRTSLYGKEKMILAEDLASDLYVGGVSMADSFELKKRRDTQILVNVYKPTSEGYVKVGEVK